VTSGNFEHTAQQHSQATAQHSTAQDRIYERIFF
jgi:hypothetical protein